MKAITLYQPHATLMAIGAKMIETRPKRWNHRGLVAIHSGLSKDWFPLCNQEPFRSVLVAAGYCDPSMLPLGRVIAVGLLSSCVTTESLSDEKSSLLDCPPLSSQERAFGNYAPNRFGYLFAEIRRLDDPIPFRGHQGYWDLPAEWCAGCDGTGLMEGWMRRDGYSCPMCHGNAITVTPD